MVHQWLLLSSLLIALISQVLGIEKSAICPFPDNRPSNDIDYCNQFTACEFTDSICHMRDNGQIGYTAATKPDATERGFKIELELINSNLSLFQADIPNLVFEVFNHQNHHLQVKIYDRDKVRYEVPYVLQFPAEASSKSPLYEVQVTDIGEPFGFSIIRSSTGVIIFNTVGALTFEDQFIQFTTKLASSYVYGFGESTHQEFRRPFETKRDSYAIFARDWPVQDRRGFNEYGHHPYYMTIEDDEGNAHSVLYYCSNAMEYATYLMDDGSPALNLRAIGGIIDLNFFLGPTYEIATQQYTEVIGKPLLPPYYFLGFQLSRWGYTSTDHIREVRERTRAMGIPQDIQVFDIDYMDRNRDFTVDPVNFGDLDELVIELHSDGIKATTILDPAIVIDIDNYPPYERGLAADAFVKWMDPNLVPVDQPAQASDYIVGCVWPDDKTVFPDFFNPKGEAWWIDEIRRLKEETLDFDVMWIDMNEPANFGTDLGFGCPFDSDWSLRCPFGKYDSPPFPTKTVSFGDSFRLSDHSICMSTVHTDGVNQYLHYDVHSLYGYSHLVATKKAMDAIFPGKRNPVLIRSTFPGVSKHGGVHWLGDNTASWSHLKMSIWGMFEFNMFGIPYVGADVCGFFGETTEELCLRWTQVGAFYPFNRNHNSKGPSDQDPAVWASVGEVARDIYLFRYEYNPYLYTIFYKVAINGGTVVRPLLANFIADIKARDIDDQFMWGDGLMVAPVMDEGVFSREIYFPEGLWYDMRRNKGGVLAAVGPETQQVDVPLTEIPVYFRGGTIIPNQQPANSTVESRLNPFGLVVALDSNRKAAGDLFWDDGESILTEGTDYLSDFRFTNDELTITVGRTFPGVDDLFYETILILGYENPTNLIINGEAAHSDTWRYSEESNSLTITIHSLLVENLSITFELNNS